MDHKGETFGLVGESGSGKTTIGRAIVRINHTSIGEILFKGRKISGSKSGSLDEINHDAFLFPAALTRNTTKKQSAEFLCLLIILLIKIIIGVV